MTEETTAPEYRCPKCGSHEIGETIVRDGLYMINAEKSRYSGDFRPTSVRETVCCNCDFKSADQSVFKVENQTPEKSEKARVIAELEHTKLFRKLVTARIVEHRLKIESYTRNELIQEVIDLYRDVYEYDDANSDTLDDIKSEDLQPVRFYHALTRRLDSDEAQLDTVQNAHRDENGHQTPEGFEERATVRKDQARETLRFALDLAHANGLHREVTEITSDVTF